jgi:DNA mismatch endonuclease (patch repair protein)
VIFVNGCFWHRHTGCKFTTNPKSNQDYWRTKFRKTIERDARVRASLETLGWEVLTIWQCEMVFEQKVARRLRSYLTRAPHKKFG